MLKKILKTILAILLALIALVAVLLLVLTIAEYRPADTEPVTPAGSAAAVLRLGDTISVLSLNAGYGALGENADFFMDGGSMVQTADIARIRQNLNDIRSYLQGEAPDLLFLQEIDRHSDRSFGIDECVYLAEGFTDYCSLFAYNYNALYVPYPLPPIGHVESGLLTLSRYPVASGTRIQLPCPFSWPIRLANLKRCLLVSRIPVDGTDHELVAVNLHLEAYDDGAGKTAQTAMLADFLKDEAEKGNYVIAGGDFNQLFSYVDASQWSVRPGMWAPGLIDPAAFDPRFSLLMDPATPSCRSLDRPLAGADREDFQYYLIDGMIVSDNLTVERFGTVPLGFAATDHNPVRLSVTLKP